MSTNASEDSGDDQRNSRIRDRHGADVIRLPLESASAGGRPGSCSMTRLVYRLSDVRRRVVIDDLEGATETQHARGKLTARERIELLLDPETFTEIGTFRRRQVGADDADRRQPATDGVVTGWGTVHGRKVFVFAHDFRLFGGSLGTAHAAKIHKLQDLAMSVGAPVIGLNDGAGARIQEGVAALAGYGGIFRRNVAASGVIPQISVMLGPCAGGAVYSPALTDFIFMVDPLAYMFITGPDVIQSVTQETVSKEELGGSEMHATRSGVATFVHDDEGACLEEVRYLLSLLPANHLEVSPQYECTDPADRHCDALLEMVPTDPRQPYDIRQVMAEIVDDHELLELHERWAPTIVCALARLDGRTVGLVGNQPMVRAGVIDVLAAQKAARFVSTCNSFNIPLVTLVDVPGFMPGLDQEQAGMIRHGAKLLYAYCNATVPRIQVILRKAYGGAYIVMDSGSIGADLTLAWPSNEIAVMGPAAAVEVLHRRELLAADDPVGMREVLVDDYIDSIMHPFAAAERGFVDEIIDPRQTRHALIDGLSLLTTKHHPAGRPGRYGNPPI